MTTFVQYIYPQGESAIDSKLHVCFLSCTPTYTAHVHILPFIHVSNENERGRGKRALENFVDCFILELLHNKMKWLSFIRLIGNHTLSCAILGINCTPNGLNCTRYTRANHQPLIQLSPNCTQKHAIIYTNRSRIFCVNFFCASYTSFNEHRAVCSLIIIM